MRKVLHVTEVKLDFSLLFCGGVELGLGTGAYIGEWAAIGLLDDITVGVTNIFAVRIRVRALDQAF